MSNTDVSRTFGALFVGAIIVFILYGLGTLQTYAYFHLYGRDSIWQKMTVFYCWFLYSLQISFLGNAVYHYVISNYNNTDALQHGYASLYVAIVFNLPLATAVQLYFTKRIWALASTKAEWDRIKVWLTAVVLFFVIVGHFGIGLGLTIRTITLGRLDHFINLRSYAIAVVAGHITSEIAISGSLCLLLAQSRTAYKRTNDVLSTLILYAINRSLLTSVLTCTGVIVFITQKGSLWSMALEFVVTSVHINSMLGALNSRDILRGKNDVESHDTSRLWRPSMLNSSAGRYSSSVGNSAWSQDTSVAPGVHIAVSKETRTDPSLEDIKLTRSLNSLDHGPAM